MDIEAQRRFNAVRIRHAFIRKVMLMLCAQLMVTFLFALLCLTVYDLNNFVRSRENFFIVIICMVVGLVISLVLACCTSVSRSYPCNLILFWIFTCCEAYLIGFVVTQYYPEIVVLAFGMTVLICFALFLFAFQTKFDFTGCGPYLLIVLLILSVMSIVAIFWYSKVLRILIASIGLLLFSIYLIADIQMMIGGDNYQVEFEEHDYIIAALSIYLDIINIFLYMLMLLNEILDE